MCVRRPWSGCYTARVSVRRALAVAVVTICIGLPLVESLDSWDRSLQSDTETNAIVAALCVGMALTTAAKIAVVRLRPFLVRGRFDVTSSFSARVRAPYRSIPIPTSGPPATALRI